MHLKRTCMLALTVLLHVGNAQTRVDLATQSKTVDFSKASLTKPFKSGIALPAICSTGEVYLLLSGQPGQNIYTCIATNSWVLQGGAGVPLPPPEPGRILSNMDGENYEWTQLSGDVAGGTATTVTGIQGRRIADSAPSDGDALSWSSSMGMWVPARGTGTAGVNLQIDGVSRGTRAVQNFLNGNGIISTATDTGTSIEVQHGINTAVVQTRANDQSGADKLISIVSSSSSTFTGTMSPTLTRYSPGMILPWTPNQSCSGSVTLNIDALGEKRIFEDDGMTAATCASGRTYLLEYHMSLDGGTGGWRKVFSSGGSVQSVNGQIGAVTITTATLGLDNVSNFGVATQTEAEEGMASSKYMTPQRTKQAISAAVGNVLNFGLATQAEAEAGTAADKYMTPQRTKQAISAAVGNVSNFGLATQAEAEAGTAADKYMTPQRTKQTISAAVGNVANFGLATQAEAEAGTAADKYMTPQRTKQAIAAAVGNVSNFGLATQAEAEAGAVADRYMTPERTKQAITYNAQSRVVGITIDGGGSTITTGTKGYVVVPFSCTIQNWSVVADQPGSITIDVWKHSSVPTALNTITGSAKPLLSSAQLAVAQPVTGWSTAVNANDVVAFNVDSASTVTRATLTIACRR